MSIKLICAISKNNVIGNENKLPWNLSEDLKIGIDYVSCKATTTDFLGFEGSKEGVSCHAVALIKK